MEYLDLTEHTSVLVALLSVSTGLVGFLIWRMMVRLEKKMEEIYRFCCDCRPELFTRFVTKEELRELRREFRQGLSRHSHTNDGEVVKFVNG